jgi:hypothetical protein
MVPKWWLLVAAVVLGGGVWAAVAAGGSNCESQPFQQLRVDGVAYRLLYEHPSPASSDLGAEIGVIDRGLPSASETCGKYHLKDGMGTPPPGSKVYAINGVDPHQAVAAQQADGTSYERFDLWADAP